MPLPAGTRIGSYQIIAALGSGGMGEVYQAHDTRLDRIVALKTLPAEKAGDESWKRRFLQEARAAAKLNHPNIVTVHEIAEEDGVCWIAMEYVPGLTLEHVLTKGALELADAIRYASDIAGALIAAHAAGVIHRDLKPGNIIVTGDGRAKLVDFGLAQFFSPVGSLSETATLQTIPGAIVGTAAYMSPEQAQGRPLDGRSDIFSFGLVLYEILSGRRAFECDSWIATVAAILHEAPRPVRGLRASIPAGLADAVDRCLQKEPASRFASMAEVLCALTGPVASDRPPEAPSIAVLPFASLSSDKDNEYFGDGLAEEIINALTKIPNLRVIARTSAFALRGKERDLRMVGQRLRVSTVLEGSVRTAANRIRVTAQLIQVADESLLWSDRYDGEMTDIFTVQDNISQSIANALKVKLVPPRRSTTSVEAFQSYLKGLYWFQRYTAESLSKARESFEQALRHDPQYAPAHAGLAVFFFGLGALGVKHMAEMEPLAAAAARRALTIDPNESDAHSVLGTLLGGVGFDWESAEQHHQAAMSAEAVPPLVRVRYALYQLVPLGRLEDALVQYRRALETDPLSMMVHYGVAHALYCLGRYDESIEQAFIAVELYPDYWLVHMALGIVQLQAGKWRDAAVHLETTYRLAPAFSTAAGFLAMAYLRSGDGDRASQLMDDVRARATRQYVSPVCFAVYHAALGEEDRMFEYLNAAWKERDPYLTRLVREPWFAPFRSDPRSLDLLRSMNLK